MKKRRLCLALLLCCALMAGCGEPKGAPAAVQTVPPAEDHLIAPTGDTGGEYQMLATLYLPSADGTQLAAVTEELTFLTARPEAEIVLKALFAHGDGEDYNALPGNNKIRFADTDALSVSSGIATVNLSAEALSLSHTDLFTVSQAITNTLCSLSDIEGVNILVAGVSPGLNVAATLPLGLLTMNTLDDPAMLSSRLILKREGGTAGDTPFRVNAALYFPAQAGRGLLAETRSLSFETANMADMVSVILDALSEGAQEFEGLPQMPDLNGLLARPPMLEEVPQRCLMLAFKENVNELLTEAGLTRSVFIASIVTTLTTFLPNMPFVSVSIGGEKVTAVVPAGLMEGAGQTIGFSDAKMRRSDFTGFFLTDFTLYFPNAEGKLFAVSRAMPINYTYSVRSLLDQLLLGPQYYDTLEPLKPAFPEGVTEADLLGTYRSNDTVLLNFSAAFLEKCAGLNEKKERALIYSIVNTLTEMSNVRRVRVYIEGEQPETLSGTISLPGEFMRCVAE